MMESNIHSITGFKALVSYVMMDLDTHWITGFKALVGKVNNYVEYTVFEDGLFQISNEQDT